MLQESPIKPFVACKTERNNNSMTEAIKETSSSAQSSPQTETPTEKQKLLSTPETKNSWSPLTIASVIFLFASAFVLSGILIFNWQYQDRSFPNLYLNGKNYGNLTFTQAQQELHQDLVKTYGEGIKLTAEQQEFSVKVEETGLSVDEKKTLEKIFAHGHVGSPWQRLRAQWQSAWSRVDLQNEIKTQDFLLAPAKRQELSTIETAPRNFTYLYQKDQFIPQPAESGQVINEEKLHQELRQNFALLQNQPIAIELITRAADVKEDVGGSALSKAQGLLNKKLVLEYTGGSASPSKDEMAEWIAFEAVPSATGIYALELAPRKPSVEAYLKTLAPKVNRKPVNAALQFTGGRVSVFAISKSGVELDQTQSLQVLYSDLFRPENFTSEADTVTLKLITKETQPEVTTENIDNLGITALLASGESSFAGSSRSRVHNITIGANKFNGVLIKSGETFSFNQNLGPVGARQGYLPELVIKQNQTIPEFGGGLCQVATTAFRAAVKAGMQITERRNHAYPVQYYAPQGTDATIYPPHPDLQFVNNTSGYLLIQTRIVGTKLFFDFYGAPDNRRVQLDGPVIYARGAGGAMKTWWKQTVFKADGSQWFTKTFYSDYKSPSLYH